MTSSNGQWIFIRAQDVWRFRDSKPFSAGQNYFARTIFPPHPTTMQGAIRTYYLHTQEKLLGSATDMGGLQITGPFLAKKAGDNIRRYLPMPLDVLQEKHAKNLVILRPERDASFITSAPDGWHPLVVREEGEYDDADGWLSERAFKAYLEDREPDLKVTRADKLYDLEDRIGLGMDHRRRANEEGLFYRAQFVRPCPDVGLLLHINMPIFQSQTGTIHIGGESRVGTYEVVDYAPPVFSVKPGNIKIVLLTPAYLRGGWKPGTDWQSWLGAEFVSAAIGKPVAVSGWDVANNAPKPLRHFLPAGSVFYFKNATLPASPFSEYFAGEADFGAMGYGTFAAGNWDYIN